MPRLIDPGAGAPIALEALIDALDTADFDVRDEESFAALGPLLARLGRNRDFLADLAVAELKDRCAHQAATNAYGAQVFLLQPANGRYVLRANFWPARDDAVVRASGTAPFYYDIPHDHNFPFLTYGYLGPGYWSDYYEYDADAVSGFTGEAAGLRFVERSRLEPDRLMLYRTRRDVHAQLPPDSFSVSLNILGYDLAQPWIDQLRFDLAAGTVAEMLTTTPSEALLSLGVHFGSGNAVDLATDFAVHHPSPRMRLSAVTALAGAATLPTDRYRYWAGAAADDHALVATEGRRRCAMIAPSVTSP